MLATRDWKISKISAARLIERLCRRRPAGGVENNNWAATPPLTIRRPANPLLPSRQRRPAQRMSLPIKRSTTWIIVTRQCRHQKAANDFFLQVHICTQSHTLSGIFKTVTFFPLLAMPLLWSIFFKELRLGMCSSRFCFFWHLRLKWKKSFSNKNIATFQILSCGCETLMQYFRYFRSMKSVLVNVQTSKQWHVPSRPGRTKLTQLFFPDWQQCKLANQTTNQPTDQPTNWVLKKDKSCASSEYTGKQLKGASVKRWF